MNPNLGRQWMQQVLLGSRAPGWQDDPSRQHPHAQQQRVGRHAGDEEGNGVALVPVDALRGMQGNNLRSDAWVDSIADDIRSGIGIREPVMLGWDPENGRMTVAEGNHRVAATRRAGASHVPAIVIRARGWNPAGRGMPLEPDTPEKWKDPLVARMAARGVDISGEIDPIQWPSEAHPGPFIPGTVPLSSGEEPYSAAMNFPAALRHLAEGPHPYPRWNVQDRIREQDERAEKASRAPGRGQRTLF